MKEEVWKKDAREQSDREGSLLALQWQHSKEAPS
jgi:hypothetical protein